MHKDDTKVCFGIAERNHTKVLPLATTLMGGLKIKGKVTQCNTKVCFRIAERNHTKVLPLATTLMGGLKIKGKVTQCRVAKTQCLEIGFELKNSESVCCAWAV